MADDLTTPYGYCRCGCGQKTRIASHGSTARGWVKGEPLPFLDGHYIRFVGLPFAEDETTHCWVWLRGKSRNGYGRMWRDSRYQQAHRVFYEDLVGPISPELTLDHLCRNRACVNPGHCEPVTNKVNVLRGNGACARHARKTHCIHGHPFDDENTITRPDGSRECRACKQRAAREYYLRKKAAA